MGPTLEMGVLNFIIFGLKTREKDYGGAYPDHCAYCDNDTFKHAFQWRRWFHVFWIPLVPWFANRALVCPICGAATELEKAAFKQAKMLATHAAALEAGESSPEAFAGRLHEFEVEVGIRTEADDAWDEQSAGERGTDPVTDRSLADEVGGVPPVETTSTQDAAAGEQASETASMDPDPTGSAVVDAGPESPGATASADSDHRGADSAEPDAVEADHPVESTSE